MSEPTFALAEFLGMTVERREVGRATAELVAQESHQNPHGFIHGAVLFAMVHDADGRLAATATGSFAVLDEPQEPTLPDVRPR